jgi:hypothetical protein
LVVSAGTGDRLAARGCWGPKVTERLVAEATAQFDPETHQDREDDTNDQAWGVALSTPTPGEFTGTSHLTATGDTLTLKAFVALVCAIAHQLFLDGDPDPLEVRKIKAIGLITALATGHAHRDIQTVLATGTTTCTSGSGRTGAGAAPESRTVAETVARAAGTRAGRIVLYLHIDAQDLDLDLDGTGETSYGTGTVLKLGAASLARLRSWVGHHQLVVRPVLNMDRRDAVDGHDPPDWMQDLVRLRDEHCIFPRCQVDAADCDLDHQTPYTPLEEGGLPGQTHPDGLACLCRRHHRAKTANVWRLHRTPDSDLASQRCRRGDSQRSNVGFPTHLPPPALPTRHLELAEYLLHRPSSDVPALQR